MPVQGDPFTYARAYVNIGNKPVQGVRSVSIQMESMGAAAERVGVAMHDFARRLAGHKRWEAERRRCGPPCAKCALPMLYEIHCRWWRCRCGHIVLREDVGYEGWRWWLFRWTGVTLTSNPSSRKRTLREQRHLYRKWAPPRNSVAPGTSRHH